jgi:hypothetical protein
MLANKKKIWIEIALHLVFWVVVLYTLTSLDSSHIHVQSKERPLYRDLRGDHAISAYVYLTLVFLALLFYGNIFWVFRKANNSKNSLTKIAICTGWFILVFGINYLVVGPFFDLANPSPTPVNVTGHDALQMVIRPDKPRPDQVELVNFMISDWGHLQPILLFAFLVIMGISLAYFFLKQWAKSELMQLSTENKFLRSQVNPHFLFNTLNNLFSMAQAKENDELADGISKLSGMMRYMLYDSNAESVLLSTEITYLEECITLNKLRYEEKEVIVKFDHPARANTISIAPMLFITFVENAFKHGVAIGETNTITINMNISGPNLIFTCENANQNAVSKMALEKSGIGLENVKRRLELLYPGKHNLLILDTAEKYFVHLEIDLK